MKKIENKDITVGLYETEHGYSLYVKGEKLSIKISKWKIRALEEAKIDWEELFGRILEKKMLGVRMIDNEIEKLGLNDNPYEEGLDVEEFEDKENTNVEETNNSIQLTLF